MKNKKVLILGGSGMLGSMVTDYFDLQNKFEITATVRNNELLERYSRITKNVKWILFDIHSWNNNIIQLFTTKKFNYIINCVGVTKPYCKDDNPAHIANAITINALFPYILGDIAKTHNSIVLQIATDCVYSGEKGYYIEPDKHDPYDVYGKTKSLGETQLDSVRHLRCSIIGPESKTTAFLLEWFLNQPDNAVLSGFTNHNWNGLTTLHFAKILHGIIEQDIELDHLQHIIPGNQLSKYELLKTFAKAYKKDNYQIKAIETPIKIDRTLLTSQALMNWKLWKEAGYETAPTIQEMIKELSEFPYRFKIK